MPKKQRVEGAMMPGAVMAEEFMAVLLWSQSSQCSCPAAKYFRKLGKSLVNQHIKEEEPSG